MLALWNSQTLRTMPFLVTVLLFGMPAHAQYSGGRGTASDPYQIATATDLMALGQTPADYDKHFILTADIDLDPNLPGRKIFDKAVIASFSGSFDGNGHTISHLTGNSGLFGTLESPAEVKDLGLIAPNIDAGEGGPAGPLAGSIRGKSRDGRINISDCYVQEGRVSGGKDIGGLVGSCDASGDVFGNSYVGGLIGWSQTVVISDCHTMGSVHGEWAVGGLVGCHDSGVLIRCHAVGPVEGSNQSLEVGGLAGKLVPFPVTQFRDEVSSRKGG